MSELDGFEPMPYIDLRTNKGKIASRDKRIEQLEGEIGGTRTIGIPSLALNYVDNKLESIGMGGELYVRQRAHESYEQVPEQGEPDICGDSESYSRWFELFGTPERAARMIANACTYHGSFDCSYGCLASATHCKCGDYDALLEWLRGDA